MPARISFVVLTLLIFQSFFSAAYAQTKKNGSLEVSPAFVEVNLTKPQEAQQVPITITNHSNRSVSLQVFPIDFKQQDGTGAISFIGQEGSYSYSLSSFLSFESESIELGPSEEKEFLVTIQNRQDLSPGGHYAAVVARMLTPEGSPEEAAVAPSVSSLLLVRKVGGEQFNLSLKEINWPDFSLAFSYPRSLTMLFQNEGNIHLVPYGRVEVRDMFGRLLSDGMINAPSFRVFPSSRRYITADLTKLTWSYPVSFNTLSVRGQDSLKKTSFIQTESFIYVNPVFLIVLLLVSVIGYRFRRRIPQLTWKAVRRKEIGIVGTTERKKAGAGKRKKL